MKLSKKNQMTALLLAREAIKAIRAEGFGLSDSDLMFASRDAENSIRQLILVLKRPGSEKKAV